MPELGYSFSIGKDVDVAISYSWVTERHHGLYIKGVEKRSGCPDLFAALARR
jgi:predicted heme/steroid binding protein